MKGAIAYIDLLIAMSIASFSVVFFAYSFESFQSNAYASLGYAYKMYGLHSISQKILSIIYYSNLNYTNSIKLLDSLSVPPYRITLYPGMELGCNASSVCRFVEIQNKTYTMVISYENSN